MAAAERLFMNRKLLAVAIAAGTVALSGCYYYGDRYGYDHRYGDRYGYNDAYYDGYYGPYNGGYWASDGSFYYYDSDHRYRRDDSGHFRHDQYEGSRMYRTDRYDND